jgi:hypothetical protein
MSPLLNLSRRGALFSQGTSKEIQPLFVQISHTQGVQRIGLFMAIMDALSRETHPRALASESYLPDPSGYMSTGMNKAFVYIRENLTQQFNDTFAPVR